MNRATPMIALAGVSLSVTGAASAADIVIGVPNWPSASATAHILELVIEENLGLDVELQNGTNPIVFEAMDKGSMHVHPEVWLPNQENLHDTYVNERGTVVQNTNPVRAEQGMCVPRYVAEEMGVTSIIDLTDPEKAALFDANDDGRGELWIGAPGWASTIIERVRARSYGYEETLDIEEYDETIAYANLDNAVEAGEPWIGFCYEPHYIFVVHDLVVLEEPPHDPDTWTIVQPTDDPAWLEVSEASTAWNGASLHLHYAKSLESDYPEVAALFQNYNVEGAMLSEMGYALVVEEVDPADYAENWVAENQDLVIDWLTQ